MELFSQNLAILAQCCDIIISKCDIKKGPTFRTFLHMFYTNFKIFVLSYNLSHFVAIFKKTDKKLAQIQGVFAPILIICQG